MFTTKRTLARTMTLGIVALAGSGCLSDSGPAAPSAEDSVRLLGTESGVGATAPAAFAAVKLLPRGLSAIEGQIEFFRTESGVVAVGTAHEMDPTRRYVTLLFDELSSGTGEACAADIGPVPYEIGRWRVDRDGRGRLKVLLDPAQLGDFTRVGSASVHRQDEPGVSASVLVACGRVEILR